MYQLTFFIDAKAQQIKEGLRCMGFRDSKEGIQLKREQHSITIIPITDNNVVDSNGYKVQVNGTMDIVLYLFDVLSCYKPQITALEFFIYDIKSKAEWIKDLIKLPSFQCNDMRGIFKKNNTGIIVCNNEVILTRRAMRYKTLALYESLKEIELIREEIVPNKFDLFSFLPESEGEALWM